MNDTIDLTECKKILEETLKKENCPEVTPDCLDQMDTYLVGSCNDAFQDYKKCVESKRVSKRTFEESQTIVQTETKKQKQKQRNREEQVGQVGQQQQCRPQQHRAS